MLRLSSNSQMDIRTMRIFFGTHTSSFNVYPTFLRSLQTAFYAVLNSWAIDIVLAWWSDVFHCFRDFSRFTIACRKCARVSPITVGYGQREHITTIWRATKDLLLHANCYTWFSACKTFRPTWPKQHQRRAHEILLYTLKREHISQVVGDLTGHCIIARHAVRLGATLRWWCSSSKNNEE